MRKIAAVVTAPEIFQKFNGLGVFEKRFLNDDYGELVFFARDLEQWDRLLMELMGPPLKPAGQKVKEEHLKLSMKYGGVSDNQTLFHKELEDGSGLIALLWPWNNGTYVTLKFAVRNKRPA